MEDSDCHQWQIIDDDTSQVIATGMDAAEAQRAAACVNACAGIVNPTDAIHKAREALIEALVTLTPEEDEDQARREFLANAALGFIKEAIAALENKT